MNPLPELSIIIVNYNGLSNTRECIRSVQTHVSLSYELIIVDNGSTADETLPLQRDFPNLICIRSDQNTGFAGGNNIGIRRAKGDYILLLNNDTLIKEDSFHFLIERLQTDSRIAAVSPKIKFAFPPCAIQFAGYTKLSPVTMRNRLIGFGENDTNQYNQPRESPYLHGAALMIKRIIIEKTGLLPEIYFLYYEELDWCTQITRAGYSLYYEPRCTVYHKESQSAGQGSKLRCFYMTRNRLLFAYRNQTGLKCWLSLFYQLTIAFLKNNFVYLIKKRPDLIRASFSGVLAFIFLKNKHA